MGFRDKFRRPLQRSVSSSTTSQTDNTASTESELSKTTTAPSRLTKTFSWRPKHERKKTTSERPHPSERPLTEMNLRHQELLGAFTMTFGRRPSRRSSFGGISPGCSRQPSMDATGGVGSDPGMRRPSEYARDVSTVGRVDEEMSK